MLTGGPNYLMIRRAIFGKVHGHGVKEIWLTSQQQQQQHKLYLHDYNYVVTVLQKFNLKKKQTNKS